MQTKLAKRHVKNTFGKDALVTVTNPENIYYKMKGTVVNGVLDLKGKYLVDLGTPAGTQFIHSDDLTLTEDLIPAPAEKGLQIEYQPSILIPIGSIEPDPNQPRKTYFQAELQELADSIEEHGILQPILIRPVPAEFPEDPHFRIVFGERRYRAAKLAGLDHVPAFIREMSDDQALEFQIIENLQRADVHPMQEAMAFRSLHNRYTLEEIGQRVGKSKSYVSVRLRFNQLIPTFQQIFLAGKMDFEDAQMLSRVTPESQERILSERTKGRDWDDEDWTIGNIEWLVRNESRNLDSATFKTEDPDLYPEMGACGKCPHNSAVNELFGEVGGRICNLTVCYGIKTQRSYEISLQAVASDPDVVMIAPNAYDDQEKARVEAAQALGKPVLKFRDYEPVRQEEKPTFEELLKNNPYSDDEEWPQEEALAQFEAELKEWEEEQAKLAKAREEGRVKKAFVVSGSSAGSFEEVVVSEQASKAAAAAAGTTGDVAAQIKDILQREARFKELDREKVNNRTFELLRGPEGKVFTENEGPLIHAEWVGLIIFIWSYFPMELRPKLQAELGLEKHHIVRGFMPLFHALYKLPAKKLESLMQRMIRPLLLQQFVVRDLPDYQKHGELAVIRSIAQEYLAEQMKQIDADQEEISSRRTARTEQRIWELKNPPAAAVPSAGARKIRSEMGRNIIKIQSEDSGQAWKKLEGPFDSEELMNNRYQELLNTESFVEG